MFYLLIFFFYCSLIFFLGGNVFYWLSLKKSNGSQNELIRYSSADEEGDVISANVLVPDIVKEEQDVEADEEEETTIFPCPISASRSTRSLLSFSNAARSILFSFSNWLTIPRRRGIDMLEYSPLSACWRKKWFDSLLELES